MGLEEDLKRLAKMRDSGDLGSEQYHADENCLLDTFVDRIHKSYGLSGATGRTPVVIRGAVTSVELSDSNEKATLLLDTQKTKLTRSGKAIAVSDGDRLIVGGTRSSNGLHAIVYVNESNGDNSVDDIRKIIPKVIAAGNLGLLAVLAILGTTAIAVMTAPPVGATTPSHVVCSTSAFVLGKLPGFALKMWTGDKAYCELSALNPAVTTNCL
jgi:hypothetical protein